MKEKGCQSKDFSGSHSASKEGHSSSQRGWGLTGDKWTPSLSPSKKPFKDFLTYTLEESLGDSHVLLWQRQVTNWLKETETMQIQITATRWIRQMQVATNQSFIQYIRGLSDVSQGPLTWDLQLHLIFPLCPNQIVLPQTKLNLPRHSEQIIFSLPFWVVLLLPPK